MSRPSHIALGDLATVDAIAEAMAPRYGLLVRLLRRTALTWCEAVALQRRDIQLQHSAIAVERLLRETAEGPTFRPLRRIQGWVRLDDELRWAMADHLDRFVAPEHNALVFTDDEGGPLLRRRFEEEHWRPALKAAGLGDVTWDVDCLQAARLWAWVQETQLERRELLEGGVEKASGWRRP